MHRTGLFLLAAFGFALTPSPARAWGNEGHRIVCEIAWRRLTPAARTFVRDIREGDSSPTFAQSCTWADGVRKTTHKHTRPYHFINIPAGVSNPDMARDCADTAKRCSPWAIQHYAEILADPSRERRERREALKFVGHFVGDLHQPLHAGRPGDEGGNKISVDFFGESLSLHSVWDSGILRRGGIGMSDAATLEDEITDAQASAWSTTDLLAWTDESYDHCENTAYVLPAQNRIRSDYFTPALRISREQLQKAGVRLAFLINEAAAGTLKFSE
jgi:hypothetical protein